MGRGSIPSISFPGFQELAQVPHDALPVTGGEAAPLGPGGRRGELERHGDPLGPEGRPYPAAGASAAQTAAAKKASPSFSSTALIEFHALAANWRARLFHFVNPR